MKSVIFFDGVCNLCNGFIDFVLRNDKNNKFSIASLQGKTAAKFLPPKDLKILNSIVLLEDGKLYYKSEAVLKIVTSMNQSWKPLAVLNWIPEVLRDFVYDLTAENRYRLFGKRDSCRLPTPEEKERFLE